jgi:hypothetical protein
MAAPGLHDKIEDQIPSILIVGLAFPNTFSNASARFVPA